MSLNVGEVCIHVLGRPAFCVGVSFRPSMHLIGGIAALVCGVICYYQFRKGKVGYGDTSSWVSNELTRMRVGRNYRRK